MGVEFMAPSEEELKQMEDVNTEPEQTAEEPAPEPEKPKDEPAPEVKEPVKPDTTAQKAEQPKEDKVVPISALHEARYEIREMRKKLDALSQIKEQVDEIRAQKQKPQVPGFEEDPLGNLKHGVDQAQNLYAETQNTLKQLEARQQDTLLQQHVISLEHEFRQGHPDYDKAVSHVLEIKKAELEEVGITDPEQMQVAISQAVRSLTTRALEQGKSPAEVAYNLAKRMGYKQEEAKVAPVASKLDMVKQAQEKAGKTLPKGGEAEVNPTASALANEKFDIFSKDFDSKWKQLFGE